MIQSLGDVAIGGALLALIVAAIADVNAFEVPNTASIVILVAAAAYGVAATRFNWFSHVASVLLMFAFGLLAFARGWLGGGDVKLMTAVAAWTGLNGLAPFFLATSLAGGLLLATLVLIRRGWRSAGWPVPDRLRVLDQAAPVPYAVAVAAGSIWWACSTAFWSGHP